MLTNFAFLKNNKQFGSIVRACLEAEKSLVISPATTAIIARRALELAVKWVYVFDGDLKVPYQDNLSSLVHDPVFRSIIDQKLFPRIKYVIKLGNVAVHTNSIIKRDEAILSLRNLHSFLAWMDYCYSPEYTAEEFDESILPVGDVEQVRHAELKDLYEKLSAKDRKLEDVVAENQKLRDQLSGRREENTKDYTFNVEEISEYETRKKYIDLDLKSAGWQFKQDIMEELQVEGMPNESGVGFVDYVLFANNGKPLALIEAKRTSKDPRIGKQQAKLYADCLENKYGQRPVIFYTNGFEIYLWDDVEYPARRVSGFYTKEELDLMIHRRTMEEPLASVYINDKITDRPYQKEAVMSVCEALSNKERKALLVMATGSGKTRTAISIVDVLTRHNWVKNVLFLADRTALVRQAKANFNNLLPHLSLCNLLTKENPANRVVFSTYPTMMNAIDETRRDDGQKLFSVGHFDLIIIDESHRSIYKKYQAIFDYFDSILLGMTATPKDEIDKNTYSVFDLENHVPTFAYELTEAIENGYLVDYRTVETKLKFLEEGIRYDELSEEEQEDFEETFEDGVEYIASEELNSWLFNDNTIDQVLNLLMEKGIKVDGGDKLGKTIIFAKNHLHAQRIVERFDCLYPEYKGEFARVIDTHINYAQSLLESFSMRDKMPQIAVSVDMLDTGIDIHEIVNLVFFKRVRSKTKFWQMIGRGTRTCENLYGPSLDKKYFLIFDFCSNFDFFRENPKGVDVKTAPSLTEKLFNIKVDIIKELQQLSFQKEEYIAHRQQLIKELLNKIALLNEDNFRNRQQLKYIHKYKKEENWVNLGSVEVLEIKEHISPLIIPDSDHEMTKRFDYLLLTIELAELMGITALRAQKRVIKTADSLAEIGSIPQVTEKKEVIQRILTTDFWDNTDLFELEEVREALRDLIKFIEREKQEIYYTDFKDEIKKISENKSCNYSNDLKSYKKKVNHYLKDHKNELAVYKLRNNKKLTVEDVERLEHILWEELGSKGDYRKEYGDLSLTRMVRETVGLEPEAANAAFAEFLQDKCLNVNQIRYISLIKDYVIKNGTMEKSVLQEDPFRALGSIVELFADDMNLAHKLIARIDSINDNCLDIIA